MKTNVYSVEWQMYRFNLTEEEAQEKILNIKQSIKEGQKKLSNFDYKAMSPKNPEHWVKKGYSEKEAIIKAKMQVTDMQVIYQEKYKENPDKYKDGFNTNINYWLKKTDGDLEKAQELLRQRQATNTLKSYNKTHGNLLGPIEFCLRNHNWSIKMEQLYKDGKYCRFAITPYTVSKIECKLTNMLKNKLKYNIKQQHRIQKPNGYYVYDILIGNNIIIEFNGDYWHANPFLYKEDYVHPFLNITAKTIWKNHDLKIKHANDNGYKTLIVWEYDFRNNQEYTINNIINFVHANIEL